MYNEKLAMALLQRLDEQFPGVTQFKNLYDFLLPQFPNVPQEEWLKSLDALLQTEMVKGVPLRDGASLIAIANIMISPNGRNELRKARVAEQRTAEGNRRAMSEDELANGQRWVEDTVARLLEELGMRLDAPIKWMPDMDREIYILEARMNGSAKLWKLTYEDLEDCVADKNVRRRIEKSLRMYFIPDVQGRTGVEPEEIRRPATPMPNTSVPSDQIDDRKFSRLAIEEARKSVPEDDRVHPRVGAVVVKDGRILASAHRGEISGCHAEYIALEIKLTDVLLSGATVYTALEPCTSRSHPKVPCAIRLTERKVHRVVIGMLDPDSRVSGKGQQTLRKAGIITDLFPHDLMAQVEELNRDFVRDRESRANDGSNANTESRPDFYNIDGKPGPIKLGGRAHSVQGPWTDVYGVVTIVNPTLLPMKIGLNRLVLGGKECVVHSFFFRLKSHPMERFERISLMGNTKEDYEVHVMFPDADSPVPPSGEGELWVSNHGYPDFPVKVSCPHREA